MIKAIETQYRGYRFRSRLEARWAVFFDALGLSWQYEPEGYDLGEAGWYLPDFYFASLPRVKGGKKPQWAEIKPALPSQDEIEKMRALCDGLDTYGCIFVGEPADCQCLGFIPGDRLGVFIPGLPLNFWPLGEQPDRTIQRAATAARSARFEHGERVA